MTHADTLRTWAAQYITPAAREPFLAGADALDSVAEQAETIQTLSRLLAGAEEAATDRAAQIERVRNALIFLEEKWAEANEEWHGKFDLHQKARAETLHDTIHLLTEALEGDTP